VRHSDDRWDIRRAVYRSSYTTPCDHTPAVCSRWRHPYILYTDHCPSANSLVPHLQQPQYIKEGMMEIPSFFHVQALTSQRSVMQLMGDKCPLRTFPRIQFSICRSLGTDQISIELSAETFHFRTLCLHRSVVTDTLWLHLWTMLTDKLGPSPGI